MDPDVLTLFLNHLFVPGTSLAEKVIRPIVVYVFLVVILRLGGRRELAQMNAFDLVVLLTLANAVQNAIIGNDTSLIGGMVGGATLIALNLAVNWYLYRHPKLDRTIEGEPVMLVKDGQVLSQHLARELITEEELLAVVHRQGVSGFEECAEVILETSGTISVLARRPSHDEIVSREIVERLDRIERLLAGQSGGLPRHSPSA